MIIENKTYNNLINESLFYIILIKMKVFILSVLFFFTALECISNSNDLFLVYQQNNLGNFLNLSNDSDYFLNNTIEINSNLTIFSQNSNTTIKIYGGAINVANRSFLILEQLNLEYYFLSNTSEIFLNLIGGSSLFLQVYFIFSCKKT